MSTALRLALVALLGVGAVACTDDDGGSGAPTVAVTTSILGDVVENIVGPDVEVRTLMPPGADPHEFQPSAREAAELREADIVIANGLGFEAGLEDVLSSVRDEGIPVFEVAPEVDPIDDDPHFFTDPARVAAAVPLIAEQLDAVGVPTDRASNYRVEILRVTDAVAAQLATIPEENRKLVTNHDVFRYFADRFGFEVVGVVIPGGSTGGEPSAAELGELADVVRDEDVPAIFADASAPEDLADSLAAEVGSHVEVVELFSESLGEPGSGGETYLDMVQTNVDRITAALAGEG